MSEEQLIGGRVELETPDGQVYHFVIRSFQLYAEETYAVLEEEKEDGQLLVTHVETDAEGAPVFVVVGEEDIVTAVLEKEVAQTIMRSLQNAPESDDDGFGDGIRRMNYRPHPELLQGYRNQKE